jgi:hypothetical protein
MSPFFSPNQAKKIIKSLVCAVSAGIFCADRGRRARFRLRTLRRGWPWYFEDFPVQPDEILLRAIPNTQRYFDETMGSWAVDPYAFEPNKKRDPDGLSFFRQDFTTLRAVAETSRHPNRARVGLIPASELIRLGVPAQAEPDSSGLAGHVIVPGLRVVPNAARSRAEKQKIADISQQLARIATEIGVSNPLGLPDPAPNS